VQARRLVEVKQQWVVLVCRAVIIFARNAINPGISFGKYFICPSFPL
jgi:hypothetical protein